MSANYFLSGEDLSFGQFKPFNHRALFFKGGGGDPDTSVKDTEDQKQLAKIAIERYDRYKKTFQPVENAYMAEVDDINSESNQKQAASMAVGNTESAFANRIGGEVDAMAGAGVNLNSGVANQAINNNTIDHGMARGQNINMTQQSLQDSQVQGYQGIVAMGNNQSSEAIDGMGKMSEYSADAAKNDAVNGFNNSTSKRQALGTVAGMAYQTVKDSNSSESTS